MQVRTRRSLLVAAAGVAALAVVVGITVTLTDTEARSPRPDRFTGYTLTKSGGIAGIRHTVEVDADGTALFIDDDPVAGKLPRRSIDRLPALLANDRLGDEDDRDLSEPRCADAFTYTLEVGKRTISRYECGDDHTPVFDEIRSLTTREGLRPLPDDAPRFAGLRVEYSLLAEDHAATLDVDPDGATTVTKRGRGEPERGKLEPRTLDALRLLYAEPLHAPARDTGVACIPERAPTYRITPTGGPTTTVSPCGRITDPHWEARLQIIHDALGYRP